MTKTLSRRQFLKAAAAGGATAAFAPLFGLNARPVTAKPSVPERVMQTVANANTFTALPSTTPLGAPLADIAMGADGTLWGTDTNGVPFSYDHLSQTWEVYMHQIDAITTTSRWQGKTPSTGGKYALPVVVMGPYITSPIDGSPLALADAFANLPDSFQLGLDGIAEVNSQLYLFRHGRYVIVDTSTSTNAVTGSPVALTSLANWPTTGDWAAGTFQALGSDINDPSYQYVHLFGYGQWMLVDMVQGAVVPVFKDYPVGPADVHEYAGGAMYTHMQAGFSALLFEFLTNTTIKLYQGGIEWLSTDGYTATPSYASVAQAAGWTPVLNQAPSGSADGLWAVTTGNRPVVNAGGGWQPGIYDTSLGDCYAVSVGSDSSVFCVTSDPSFGLRWALRQLQNGSWSAILAETSNQIVQLEVGDANHIWFRDAYNNVLRYQNGGISQASEVGVATHIAANADGTLWHATGDANAYRFISEGTAPSTALSVGAGGSVTRVASSGFASAFVLAHHPTALADNGSPATQLYTYASPYVWKTGPRYFSLFGYQQFPNTLALGGQSVFAYCTTGDSAAPGQIFALDAQTGTPVWPTPFTLPHVLNDSGGTLVYDSATNLVYVGNEGSVHALNATSGSQVWTFEVLERANRFSPAVQILTLTGTHLTVTATDGTVTLIDTHAALASAKQQQPVTKAWTSQSLGSGVFIGQPCLDASGTVYMQGASPVPGASSSTPVVQALNAADGTRKWQQAFPSVPFFDGFYLPFDSVYGTTIGPDGTTSVPALLVNTGGGVYALNPADGTTLHSFLMQPPQNGIFTAITTTLTYQGGRLYFGNYQGTLYVLDALTFQVIAHTTDMVQDQLGVVGRVALISNGNATNGVVAVFTRGNTNVYVFDPDSGNETQVATDLTAPSALLYDSIHGLLYAMGWDYSQFSSTNPDPNLLGQLFAMRLDQALQDERAFIIESQLMQDYHNDNEATSTNGNARYQTHVTIVDDNNVPMSNTSVKLWAEEDNTSVSIDGGAPVTIGPDTPTLFTTDSSGSFTVISGGFASDGTTSTDSANTADLFAVTLQVWAAFMDPSERIIITPDAEFHGRMAAAKASGNTESSQADPTGIDLSSTQSYDGTALFSASSSNDQAAATSMASAITQMTGATGVGASATGAHLRRTLGGRLLQQPTATPPKYHAYTDLPGMSYTPVSALINQGLNPTTPLGISFTSTGGFATHTPGEAADIIDAMQGTETVLLGSLLSKLRDAWKTIKADALKVVQAVVSVAKEVYVGIQYVAAEGLKVIKAVAADIKDAMATIGSFFVQLGKDIKNTVEALSILLHFDEFIKTQKFIKGYYTTMVGRLKNDLDTGFNKLYDYLGGMSTTVKDDFTKLIGDLQGNVPSTGVGASSGSWGAYTAGTSPHATLSVAPVNGSAPKKSVAVQGMWAAHKSRQNASATTTPTATLLADTQSDILAQLEDLFSDPNLFSNVDTIKSQFTSGISLKSPQAFFDGVFADILLLIEAAILGGIDIAQGVVQKLKTVTDSIAALFQNGGEFYIPIITPLWTKLGLPQLQIIDLVTLIAAIPVTLVYRVLSGHWLSQDVSIASLAAVGVTPPQVLTNIEGIITSMITLFNGFINAIGDTFSALIDPSLASIFPTPPWVTISGYANMVLMAVGPIYNTVEQNGDPLYLMVIGLNVISNLLSLFWGKVKNAAALGQFLSWLLSLFTLIIQWIGDGSEGQPWETILSDILANVPGCLSLLKYVDDTEVKLVPPIADLGCAVAAAAIALAGTIKSWGGTSNTRQYYRLLPVVIKS